ncbi:MAG: hypothetical protein OWT28_00335 [Firmicutes bacterium]|nr:hypothetical protein [Bacillota bacterium]
MISSSRWRVVKSYKGGFVSVYLVKREVAGETQTGYFKYASPATQEKHLGPLIANELLGYRFGCLLDLPMAQTEIATVRGRLGVVSVQGEGNGLRTWADVAKDVRKEIERRLVEPERLLKTFVFDTWICNIDRSGKNIIVYEKDNGVLDYYLIDHELALLGALRFENKTYDAHHWDNIRRYTRGYHPALLPYATDYQRLQPFVEEIQSLDVSTIRAVLDDCPTQVWTRKDRVLVEKLLVRRQRKLGKIVKRCVEER